MKTNLVIGSGPSGLAAVKFLIGKNQKVILVDGANEKQHENENFNFKLDQKTSPKFQSLLFKFSNNEFKKKYSINQNNFFLTSSIVRGGLTNFWGGGLEIPSENYLKKNEINKKDYKKNIIQAKKFFCNNESKQGSDFKKNLDVKFKYLKSAFNFKNNKIVKLDLALTNENNKFQKICNFSNLCLKNCDRNSLYNYNNILSNLDKKKFQFQNNKFVVDIKKNNKKYSVFFDDKTSIIVDKIFCCAGTVGSTILISKLLKIYNKPIRLFHNPMYQLLFFSINKFKNIFNKISLPYAKIIIKYKQFYNSGSIVLLNDQNDNYFKNIFLRTIFKLFKNFFIGGNFFISQQLSKTYICLKEKNKIELSSNNFKNKTDREILKKISKYFIINKLIPVPFLNGKKFMNGSDTHYTSTLYNFRIKNQKIINNNGEVKGYKNLFVLDGSIIPPGLAYPTLFIVCNVFMKLSKIFKNEKQI
tara:strand:+ start:2597 stop:4012 length:1416 start_codon:yes stop_codon:yes gene_type:complete